MTSDTRTTFSVENGQVVMNTVDGPIYCTDAMCEGLLDLFENAEGYAAARLWNGIYEAYRACGGIERCTSRRAA